MTGSVRGIRLNNPLNLEYNPANKWIGLADDPTDGRFCRFSEPIYGLRAACKILLGYQSKYGLTSVQAIINRFAPPHENDTDTYAYKVARFVGVQRNEAIDVRKAETMRLMLRAMIRQECGSCPFSDEVLNKAMALAGIRVSQPTMEGKP